MGWIRIRFRFTLEVVWVASWGFTIFYITLS